MEARLSKIRAKEKAQRQQYLRGESAPKKRKPESNQKVPTDQNETEEQFVLDDYDSDDEKASSMTGGAAGLSAATRELMEKLGMSIAAPKEEEDEGEDEVKVIDLPLFPGSSNIWRYSTALELIRNSLNS
jgi:chromosome transmission fidelity protein 1